MVSSAEIVSEMMMIKPSSPTPLHLRQHKLSFLDQLAPPIYIHIILYYQLETPHHKYCSVETMSSEQLKRSLADALTIYYPLAGRLRDMNSWVDCNDQGAEYFEARFNDAQLSDIIQNPYTTQEYVPAVPRGCCDIPLAVQVNFFGCGGTAIGVCMSHKLADATSLVMFINAWAAACRGDLKTNLKIKNGGEGRAAAAKGGAAASDVWERQMTALAAGDTAGKLAIARRSNPLAIDFGAWMRENAKGFF
ncbi:hypothetical protein BUALT_Bualt18G0035900 [Buddleja alternifolia]|uniref:Uncharacterized protein n=1 Tax=Buddleja alternifolia TaxID=168488 RepID=A0AAV6WCX7_9LAMI|nr:hypothetical protein BUALT_Bualt18G0035900 [Buddleja alternifolia]